MDDIFEKIAVGFVVLFVLLTFVVIPVSISLVSRVGATNAGEHTGYVTAVEQEGWLWKTWRVYVKTDVSSSQEDKYCVVDESLVSELKGKAKSRELVTVNYSAPFIVWNWECADEPSIVSGIN